jgi:hypothetical protein
MRDFQRNEIDNKRVKKLKEQVKFITATQLKLIPLSEHLDKEALVETVRDKFRSLETTGDLDASLLQGFLNDAFGDICKNHESSSVEELLNELGTPLILRDFVMQVLINSPMTAGEKLDLIYETLKATNRFADGVDIQSTVLVFHNLLNAHMCHISVDQLYTAIEGNDCGGVLGAYWTRKDINEIKFEMYVDLSKSADNGVVSCSEFLDSFIPSVAP